MTQDASPGDVIVTYGAKIILVLACNCIDRDDMYYRATMLYPDGIVTAHFRLNRCEIIAPIEDEK